MNAESIGRQECDARLAVVHQRLRLRKNIARLGFFCVLMGLTLLFTGCAQNTDAPFKETVTQTTPTPVSADQEAATQGSQVYVYITNAPGKSTLPDPASLNLTAGEGGSDVANVANVNSDAAGNSSGTTKAGFLQSGFTVNITTGGTAPSLSSAPNVGPTVSSVANPNSTVSPNLDARANLSAPIAFGMPGSSQSQQSAAASEGGEVGPPTQTNANPANYTNIKATPEALQQLQGLLDALKQQVPAAPTPPAATQPAGQ